MKLAPVTFVVASVVMAGAAQARIILADAVIRKPPPGAPTAAGYLTITNTGAAPDRLLGGSTPAATRIEVHRMTMTGMVMRMRPVAGGLVIGPRQTLKLSDEGYHLMLVQPRLTLGAGGRVPATLRFERAGAVRVLFRVGQP